MVTMQLSLAWFGFRDHTPSNYFHTAAALGVRHVEIPFYQQIIEDPYYHYTSDGMRRLQEMADEAQVRMVAGVAALDLAGDWDSSGRADRIDSSANMFARATAYRVIDVAAALDVELVRILEPDIPADREAQAKTYIRTYGDVLSDLRLGDYAAERGVRIVVENYGMSAAQMCELLDAVDNPAVGTLYDPCNYHRLGEDPIEALRLLRGRVFYCHVKDAIRGDPRSPDTLFQGSRWPPSVAVGEGAIEWPDLLQELATSYGGYLAIEYEMSHDVVRGTRRSIKHLHSAATAAGLSLTGGNTSSTTAVDRL